MKNQTVGHFRHRISAYFRRGDDDSQLAHGPLRRQPPRKAHKHETQKARRRSDGTNEVGRGEDETTTRRRAAMTKLSKCRSAQTARATTPTTTVDEERMRRSVAATVRAKGRTARERMSDYRRAHDVDAKERAEENVEDTERRPRGKRRKLESDGWSTKALVADKGGTTASSTRRGRLGWRDAHRRGRRRRRFYSTRHISRRQADEGARTTRSRGDRVFVRIIAGHAGLLERR